MNAEPRDRLHGGRLDAAAGTPAYLLPRAALLTYLHGLVAQGIEHRSPKAGVARSIRAWATEIRRPRGEVTWAQAHGRTCPWRTSSP